MHVAHHTPMLKIHTKTKGVFYISAANREMLEKDMETKQFVKINQITLNRNEITSIEPHQGEYDVFKLNHEEKQRLEARKKSFFGNIGRYPTEREIDRIMRKMFPDKMMDVPMHEEEKTYYYCDWGTRHISDKSCSCDCEQQLGCGVMRFWEIMRENFESIRYNHEVTEEAQEYVKNVCKRK